MFVSRCLKAPIIILGNRLIWDCALEFLTTNSSSISCEGSKSRAEDINNGHYYIHSGVETPVVDIHKKLIVAHD